MSYSLYTSELLNSAFQLAYFIHGDKATAIRISTEALAKLEIACAAQDKRLYYVPIGRLLRDQAKRRKYRTKVSMSELHLLQRLVYMESEPYERCEEQSTGGTSLAEEDMIIRYIKHLVKITVRRNSFYVTLGLSRLLYNYSTAETMDIYNLVVQDPERVKDDSYYRSCKGRLMLELQERFGNLLKVIRGHRGEERFQAHENPDEHIGLVRRCLQLFTPWKTTCVVPERFDPMKETIAGLEFEGDDPDKEHPVEINRIHSVLHPDCYARLIRALGFDSPEGRLAIPQFSLSKGEKGEKRPRGDRYHPPQLEEEEVIAIRNELAERAARRKVTSGGLLLIVVDGIERARLDLNQTKHVRFEVDEGAELIEVRAREKEGDVLLATCVLTHYEAGSHGRPQKRSIVLEGGQKLSFTVSLSKGPDGHVVGALVDIGYRETNPVRAASLFLRQLKYQMSESLRLESWDYSSILKPALAFVLMAASVVGITLYVQSRKQQPRPPLVAEREQQFAPLPSVPPGEKSRSEPELRRPTLPQQPVPSPGPEQKQRVPTTSPERPMAPQPSEVAKKEERPPAAQKPAPPERVGEDVVETRGVIAGVQLLSVKRVYVEPLGDDPMSQKVRDMLVRSLQVRFILTKSRKDADAVLKGTVIVRQEELGGQLTVGLILINAAGDVLWATTQKSSGSENRDLAMDVTAKVVKELLEEIQRLEQKREQPKKD